MFIKLSMDLFCAGESSHVLMKHMLVVAFIDDL